MQNDIILVNVIIQFHIKMSIFSRDNLILIYFVTSIYNLIFVQSSCDKLIHRLLIISTCNYVVTSYYKHAKSNQIKSNLIVEDKVHAAYMTMKQ